MTDDERRHLATRARQLHRTLGRLIDLFEEGLSDAQIAERLGWADRKTALRYRQVYQLRLNGHEPARGRWSDAHAQMHEVMR